MRSNKSLPRVDSAQPGRPKEAMLRDFADYLLGLGLAPSTVRMYRALMRKCADWADEQGIDLREPTAAELSQLRDQFVESPSTLRQLRCALQHYWDMHDVRHPPARALRVPPKPRPRWRGIPDDQARQLAITAAGWHPEGTATLIALYTGLRRAEIAAMRWDRFNADLSEYTVMGKGQVTDMVPISPHLQNFLRPLRGGFVWLFPGQRKLHVSPATIWAWVRTVAEEAGVQITTHQLRHTAVNRIYREAGLLTAQRFARHARSDTTEVYLKDVTAEEVREAASKLDWLGPLRVVGNG